MIGFNFIILIPHLGHPSYPHTFDYIIIFLVRIEKYILLFFSIFIPILSLIQSSAFILLHFVHLFQYFTFYC